MTRARSKQKKDDLRKKRFQELGQLWNRAYYDRERAEIASLDTCLYWNIDRGDILADSRGFLHPELDKSRNTGSE